MGEKLRDSISVKIRAKHYMDWRDNWPWLYENSVVFWLQGKNTLPDESLVRFGLGCMGVEVINFKPINKHEYDLVIGFATETKTLPEAYAEFYAFNKVKRFFSPVAKIECLEWRSKERVWEGCLE